MKPASIPIVRVPIAHFGAFRSSFENLMASATDQLIGLDEVLEAEQIGKPFGGARSIA